MAEIFSQVFSHLKWIIPVTTGVAVALVTLWHVNSPEIPWSRAFLIAASLLIATAPIIESGKIGKGGLEFVTRASNEASEGLEKLDHRLVNMEKAVDEFQKLSAEIKSSLATTLSPESRLKLDDHASRIKALALENSKSKIQFDVIKKRLDNNLSNLGVRLGP